MRIAIESGATRRRWRATIRVATASTLAAAMSIALVACGDNESPSEKAALSGRAFTALDAEGLDLPPGSSLQLTFDGLRLRMTGGCNTGTADYDVVDDLLVVQAMALTEMACDADLMALDAAVVALLTAKPTVMLNDDDLTLAANGVRLRLSDGIPDVTDRPLEGTLWVVSTVLHLDAASGGFGGARATVVLVGDVAEVNGGCNSGSAAITIDEGSATQGTIEFGLLGLTKMACEQSTMELEFAVALVLQGTVTYRIDGDRLTLLHGEYGLVLEAAADA